MHDHVVTKRVMYPLLTANVQQQVYFVSHAALKVVSFGLLAAKIWVQSQGVDRSSYCCPLSEYLDMSCDSPVGYTWTEKYGEADRVDFETLRSDIPKIWDFFYLLSNTVGSPWTTDKHQVSGIFYLSNTPTNAYI